VIISSIAIIVRDGEIDNYIDSSIGNEKSSISPIIEVVLDDLSYITQTNTIKNNRKKCGGFKSTKSMYTAMPIEKYIECINK
jgi:hypothetical protein